MELEFQPVFQMEFSVIEAHGKEHVRICFLENQVQDAGVFQ